MDSDVRKPVRNHVSKTFEGALLLIHLSRGQPILSQPSFNQSDSHSHSHSHSHSQPQVQIQVQVQLNQMSTQEHSESVEPNLHETRQKQSPQRPLNSAIKKRTTVFQRKAHACLYHKRQHVKCTCPGPYAKPSSKRRNTVSHETPVFHGSFELPPLPTQLPPIPTQQQPLPTQHSPLPTQLPPLPTQLPPLPTQLPPLPTQQQPLPTPQQPLPTQLPPLPTQLPPLPTQPKAIYDKVGSQKGVRVYIVEDILEHRVRSDRSYVSRDTIEFLVKWQGYDSSQNTWEPYSSFVNRRHIITTKLQKYLDTNYYK